MSRDTHDEYLLGAYVLDLLDPDEVEQVRWHLARCVPCRTEHGRLRRTRELLARIPSAWLATGPPAEGSRALAGALRSIRARGGNPEAPRRRVLALAAGLLAVFSGFVGYRIKPAAAPPPPPPSPSISALMIATGTDSRTRVTMTASVIPAMDWVRVRVSVTGIPAGQDCRLVVVRHDGTSEIAGGWTTSRRGETEATVLDGSAAIPVEQVAAVAVQNTAGTTFVRVTL